MKEILEPDLAECIEKKAKREYQRVSALLLNGSPDYQLAAEAEILSDFLIKTSFNSLRSEYEPLLVKGKKITFKIYREAETVKYIMNIDGGT